MSGNALIEIRRDTAANWTSVNPILAAGEPGYETDTKKIKYGDGATAWVSLAYASGSAGTNLLAANNLSDVVSAATARTNLGLTSNATATLDTDVTLAANSDTNVASQKAIKSYIANKLVGMFDLRGSTDCSANPNYPAAVKGDSYAVTVAGKIGGASGVSVAIGDVYFATADNVGGTQAAVGTSWDVLVHASVAAGGGMLAANNLSDVASVPTARTNLGLAAATTTDIWAGTDATKPIVSSTLYTSSAEVALTDGATVTPDFNVGTNFSLTKAINGTLANPTNAKSGQSGIIVVTQDATGSRTLAFGTNWKFAGGAPVLSTAANSIDMIAYSVRPSGIILATISKAFA